jgi:hypothetical protein
VSSRLWLRTNLVLCVIFAALSVFCITPGPGQSLARNLVYLTFISHLDLALVLACLATVAGARAELASKDDDRDAELALETAAHDEG